MWLTVVSGLAALVALLALLLATVGAVVSLVLVAGAMRAGLALTGHLVRTLIGSAANGSGAARVGSDAVHAAGLGQAAHRALRARQAPGRLRC